MPVFRPSAETFRQLIDSARWTLQETWSTQAGLVLGLAVVTLARGLFPAAFALAVRGLINAATHAVNSPAEALNSLLPWLGFGLGLTIAELVSSLSFRFLMRCFTDEIDLSITAKVLTHAARLEVAVFEDPHFQDIIHRAQQNIGGNVARFLTNTLAFISDIFQIISLVIVLAAIEPFVLGVLPPLAFIHFLFQWRLSKNYYLVEYRRATQRRWTQYFLSLLTSRRSVPEVKLLGLSPVLINRCRMLLTEFRDQNRHMYRSGLIGGSVIGALATVAFYALLANVLRRFLWGTVTIGDVTVFGTVGLRLRGTVETAVQSMTGALEQALYVYNLREFLNIQPRISSTAPKQVCIKGAIEFRNVSFTYPGSEKPAVSNISFRIHPGEIVAIVGANGSGKTTLTKLITRFYGLDSGLILYDGNDLRELSLEDLCSQVAFVFQNSIPFEATASENIAYGDWRRLLEDRNQVQRIACYSGVDTMIEKMPQGYDTPLGRSFGKYDLSDGQWQQIAIARAFARNAAILILDEPTSSLDALAEYELFNRLRKLADGRTTILISHRFSTVRMADRIIVMDKGCIVESGTHTELLADRGYYAKFYYTQRKQMGLSPNEM